VHMCAYAHVCMHVRVLCAHMRVWMCACVYKEMMGVDEEY
jgi:hypothetical protein